MVINTKTIHICKNDKSFTNYIELWYKVSSDTEHIAARALLPRLLLATSKKYPTEDDMERALTLNYITGEKSGTIMLGNSCFFTICMEIPQKKKIKDFNVTKCLDFIMDIIYRPNVKENRFVQFDEKIKILKSNMEHTAKEKIASSIEEIKKILDEDGSLINSLYHHQEQLDILTAEKEYQFYKEIVYQKPFIFLHGNDEVQEIKTYLTKYFDAYSDISMNIEKEHHYLTLNHDGKEIEVKKSYRESLLSLIYKVDNMKEDDEKYLIMVNDILSYKSSNLLLKKLRIEKKLVYRANSMLMKKYGVLVILGGIYRENKQKMIEAVNELFELFNDEEKISKILEKLHEQYECDYIRDLDGKGFLRSEFLDKFFKIEKTERELIDELKTITPSSLKQFMKRLKLDYIYFLKGETDAN